MPRNGQIAIQQTRVRFNDAEKFRVVSCSSQRIRREHQVTGIVCLSVQLFREMCERLMVIAADELCDQVSQRINIFGLLVCFTQRMTQE